MACKRIPTIAVAPTAAVVRLLDARAFDLKEIASDLLRSVWENLVMIDREKRQITIRQKLDGKCLTFFIPFSVVNGFQVKLQLCRWQLFR